VLRRYPSYSPGTRFTAGSASIAAASSPTSSPTIATMAATVFGIGNGTSASQHSS